MLSRGGPDMALSYVRRGVARFRSGYLLFAMVMVTVVPGMALAPPGGLCPTTVPGFVPCLKGTKASW
jgi:hypothetical protein